MIVIELTTGNRSFDPLSHKTKAAPRFRKKNFTGITVRDAVLEIVRTKFTGLPDVPDARELHFPGELGMFVYVNLLAYIKQSKAAPVIRVSDREKYFGKISNA